MDFHKHFKMDTNFQSTEGAVMVMYTEIHTGQFAFANEQNMNRKLNMGAIFVPNGDKSIFLPLILISLSQRR